MSGKKTNNNANIFGRGNILMSGKLPRMTNEERKGWIAAYWKARKDGRGTNVKELLISCAILLITMMTASFLTWIMLENLIQLFSGG